MTMTVPTCEIEPTMTPSVSPMSTDSPQEATERASSNNKNKIDLGSPEGFEVFVGRMPLRTSEKQLQKLASCFSPTSVQMRPKRRYDYLCGFVVFDDLDNAQNFISAYHGKCPFDGLHPLNVRFSDGKNSTKKIFVGGLSDGTTSEDLKKLVSSYGTVVSANICGYGTKSPCGFVTFATAHQAESCISSMHNTKNPDCNKTYVVRHRNGSATAFNANKRGQPGSDESGQDHKRRRKNANNSNNMNSGNPMRKWLGDDINSDVTTAANTPRTNTPVRDNIEQKGILNDLNVFGQPMQMNMMSSLVPDQTSSMMNSPNMMSSLAPDQMNNMINACQFINNDLMPQAQLGNMCFDTAGGLNMQPMCGPNMMMPSFCSNNGGFMQTNGVMNSSVTNNCNMNPMFESIMPMNVMGPMNMNQMFYDPMAMMQPMMLDPMGMPMQMQQMPMAPMQQQQQPLDMIPAVDAGPAQQTF